MKQNIRLNFQRGDIFSILAVLIIAGIVMLIFYPEPENDSIVQIFQNGKNIGTYSINKDTVIEIDGNFHNTITIHNGKVAVTASDCPGQDCMHSGWIAKPERSIVCLPNRVEIRIVGSSNVDFIVR